MITLKAPEDLNWDVITAVAYEQARFDIAPELAILGLVGSSEDQARIAPVPV